MSAYLTTVQFTTVAIACLISASVAAIVIALLGRLAAPLGLVDCPDQRKRHIGQIPLIGGIAVFAGVLVAALWLGDHSPFIEVLLGTTCVIALLGAADDRHGLSVRLRVLLQTTAILVVIFSTGVYVRTLGQFMGHELSLGWMGIPFTVVAVIGLINAFNLMDGIDGLAGSLALVSIVSMALFIGPGDVYRPMLLMALMAASLLPFLACNLGVVGRKIFLGDAGSMILGYLIAWSLIRISQVPQTRLAPVGVLWCVALPVLDTLAVMYRRLRARQSPFKPDRGHIHHILMNAGLGPRVTLVCLLVLAGLMALVGEASRKFGHGASLQIFILLLVTYVFTINRIWWRQRARLAHPRKQEAANDPELGVASDAIQRKPRVVELHPYQSGKQND
ncbi:MAG: MraY family glycosyltransferase [Rhodanobacter sp.]